MKRRDFIALLGGATAWPLAARAQQAMPVGRVRDHGPCEAGNLARSQAGFGRQKDNDFVSEWVSAGFGEQQEVFEIVIR